MGGKEKLHPLKCATIPTSGEKNPSSHFSSELYSFQWEVHVESLQLHVRGQFQLVEKISFLPILANSQSCFLNYTIPMHGGAWKLQLKHTRALAQFVLLDITPLVKLIFSELCISQLETIEWMANLNRFLSSQIVFLTPQQWRSGRIAKNADLQHCKPSDHFFIFYLLIIMRLSSVWEGELLRMQWHMCSSANPLIIFLSFILLSLCFFFQLER